MASFASCLRATVGRATDGGGAGAVFIVLGALNTLRALFVAKALDSLALGAFVWVLGALTRAASLLGGLPPEDFFRATTFPFRHVARSASGNRPSDLRLVRIQCISGLYHRPR